MDHFFSEFGGGEVEFVIKMVIDIVITSGLIGTNCNMGASDERKKKKKWGGVRLIVG